MVHFGLANAKIQFGIRAKWSTMVIWTILVQYTFRLSLPTEIGAENKSALFQDLLVISVVLTA